jgi:hypothetical protein
MEEPQLTRACVKCGKVLDVRGLNTHQRYCDGTAKPTKTALNGPKVEPPHKQGVTKMWTVSMVNGNRQVAGTVPEYVAQRILRMLI